MSKNNALRSARYMARQSFSCSFNIRAPLFQVPLIEPLVMKKIAHERLTELIFREECLVTACQDGYVCTWARPGKRQQQQHANNVSGIHSLLGLHSFVQTFKSFPAWLCKMDQPLFTRHARSDAETGNLPLGRTKIICFQQPAGVGYPLTCPGSPPATGGSVPGGGGTIV